MKLTLCIVTDDVGGVLENDLVGDISATIQCTTIDAITESILVVSV